MESTVDELKRELESLKKIIKDQQNKIDLLQKQLNAYEMDGVEKLFYSLNRKSYEMADLLNKTNLSTIDLSNKDDKTFERLKVIWNDASSIATAVKALEDTAGFGSQNADSGKPKFRKATTPESMADEIGELAGKKG